MSEYRDSQNKKFVGFLDGEAESIIFPKSFLDTLIPTITDLDELKFILAYFWLLSKQKEFFLPIPSDVFLGSEQILSIFDNDAQRVEHALRLCIKDNVFIEIKNSDDQKTIYLLNSPRGRATYEAYQSGSVKFEALLLGQIARLEERPNIFKLYEENIGPLTPMIADILKQDEEEYSSQWILEAIEIAVKKNVRNWKYVHAILESWQKEGRNAKDAESRQNPSEDREQYRKKWLGEDG